MSRQINISEARGKLPELAQLLVRSPGEVVWIEHRDLDERLALTTESHIQRLQLLVKELRKQVTRPFKLAGSLESELSDEEIEVSLQAIRKEQNRLEDISFAELAS
jgi:Ni,Fe-hydrogenase maturation factor